MASKALYLSLAIAGIAVASATAYWWQHERAGASSLTRPAAVSYTHLTLPTTPYV